MMRAFSSLLAAVSSCPPGEMLGHIFLGEYYLRPDHLSDVEDRYGHLVDYHCFTLKRSQV